jgi:hypothetical protein
MKLYEVRIKPAAIKMLQGLPRISLNEGYASVRHASTWSLRSLAQHDDIITPSSS